MMYLNMALRFMIELTMLGIIGYGGYVGWGKDLIALVLAVLLVLVVMVLWGLFMAPKAPYLISALAKLVVEIVTLAITIGILFVNGFHQASMYYAILSYGNLLFLYILK